MAANGTIPISYLTPERDEILVGACRKEPFNFAAIVCGWLLASLEAATGCDAVRII